MQAVEQYQNIAYWANELNISYSQLNAWCKCGKLRHVNVGSSQRPHRMARRSAVLECLAAQEEKAR